MILTDEDPTSKTFPTRGVMVRCSCHRCSCPQSTNHTKLARPHEDPRERCHAG